MKVPVTVDTSSVEAVPAEGVLSTDHAASSYGQPVLIINGTVYGPGDRYTGYAGEQTSILFCRTTCPWDSPEQDIVTRWNQLVRNSAAGRLTS